MTSASVALPRRIVRRIRPPSAWTVYRALECAVILGFIAQSIMGLSLGHPLAGLAAVAWSLSYVFSRRQYQMIRRLERTLDATLPPVPRRYWAFLVFLVAFQAYGWLTIGA